MPRRGGGTNPEEAAAFVTRLAKDRETFAEIQAREAWERHVREYLTGDPEGQLSPALERFQRYAYEEMRGMNFNPSLVNFRQLCGGLQIMLSTRCTS
jgi:hypothetical protein